VLDSGASGCIAVDVGGTFTDLVYVDFEARHAETQKVLSTPHALELGVLDAIRAISAEGAISRVSYFLHGTTVGLNALLQRRGATIGLLTTKGFRDTLEIGRSDYGDPYDLFWSPPAPLVPRRLRLPITERTTSSGAIHTPVQAEDVRAALGVFLDAGVDSIAVAFLNSYANPEHELAALDLLLSEGFSGSVSLSHIVSREYREYERTSTTVIDAFVRPTVSGYLERLEEELRALGFRGTALVARSDGCAMTFAEAKERPFETILSGPVAGAMGAADLASKLGLERVISADVGGTSFDTCFIEESRPSLVHEGRIMGMPIQAPWIDVRTIGAGGGSIANIGADGLLRVGPQSAGADPGPASYGRGGSAATLTDAALVLGMLGSGRLAGGISLDRDRAREALRSTATEMGLSIEEAARGVVQLLTSRMANAIRELTIEEGRDPREMSLVMFGGAGPLLACVSARELEMSQIVIPSRAGSFSAQGLLVADLSQTASQTCIAPLGSEALAAVDRLLPGILTQLRQRTGRGPDDEGTTLRVQLELRYVGQEHTLQIDVPANPERLVFDSQQVQSLFHRTYAQTFGQALSSPVEIVTVRASLITTLSHPGEAPSFSDAHLVAAEDFAEAYSFTDDRWRDFRVVHRQSLSAEGVLAGPALVLDETATIYVDSGFVATKGSGDCLILRFL